MPSLLNLEFASIYGYRPLLIDLHLPEGASAPTPVVLWIHGGGYTVGTKTNSPALPLVDRGIAVASLGYRRSAEAKLPAQLHDAKGAVRWLRANAAAYNLDPERIGAWGSSAGGQLALLLGLTWDRPELEGDVGGNLEYSSQVSVVVDWSGVTDIRESHAHSASVAAMLELALGRPPSEAAELIDLLNPATYARLDAPATLVIHTKEDPQVPLRSAEGIHAALQAAGADVTLRVLDGAVHGSGLANVPAAVDPALDFLARHLAKARVHSA